MDQTKIKADADTVSNIMELLNNTINPFDNEYNCLVHLTNGSIAPTKVDSDMKNMYQKGILQDRYTFRYVISYYIISGETSLSIWSCYASFKSLSLFISSQLIVFKVYKHRKKCLV